MATKLAVCMVISKLVPFENGVFVGGATNSMVNLSRALVERGHRVFVVAGSPEPEQEEDISGALDWAEVEFVRIRHRTPIRRAFFLLAGLTMRARSVCRRHNCDIVHGHAGYAAWAAVPGLVGRLCGRPAIQTVYCPLGDRVEDTRHRAITGAAMAKWTLRAVDQIVAISDNVRSSLLSAGVEPKRMTVIPPPIDDRRFRLGLDREEARARFGFHQTQTLVLFVGNLTETKGLDVLLEAFATLVNDYRDLTLVCAIERGPSVSAGREEVVQRRIRDLGIRDRTVEFGVISDMPALMAACDIVVVPFRSTEGPSDFPLAMLEAMAVGKPVVASRVGAIPEVMREGEEGLLVPAGDSRALSLAIASLLDDRDSAQQMGRAATQAVRSRFAPTAIAGMTEEVYFRALAKEGRAEL